MNKNNAKALSTLRQKIRKYNRDYENEIASYKEVGYSWNFALKNDYKHKRLVSSGCRIFNITIALLICGICPTLNKV